MSSAQAVGTASPLSSLWSLHFRQSLKDGFDRIAKP